MRTFVFTALAAASITAASFAALAAQPLLPAGHDDQIPTRLVSLPAPVGQFERAPVSFSWALDPLASLTTPETHVAESREYWQTVDGAELARGIDLTLTSPGAVIRVSPGRNATQLKPADIRVHGNGKAARLQQSAGDAELQAAGMDVDPGSVVVKLAPEHAGGRYQLHVDNAKGRYVVHVFEPDSDTVLRARADRSHALSGETIAVDIAMTRGGRDVSTQAEALLVAPDGSSQPVTVAKGSDGNPSARVRLPAKIGSTPGLWELQVFANGEGVSRDARTAFAVAAPTARFAGDYAFDTHALRVALPIEAGSVGRYEARGTLYASGPDRVLRPVAQAHAAAWFERGRGMLVLDFDRSQVPSGYGAPFEIRQLQLHDQARLAPLETRERGARF